MLLSGSRGSLRDILLVLDWLVDRLLLVLLVLGSLVRTSLLHNILSSIEQVVKVGLDKLGHGVLSQGLGSLRLVEELVDKEEGGDTSQGSSQDLQLGLINCEGGSSKTKRLL